MRKKFMRADRVAQQIQRELADIIRHELKTQQIGMLTLTDVELSRDLSHAKVFYTLLNSDEDPLQTAHTLGRVSGFLRSQLARRIKLFTVPTLTFIYDKSIEEGRALSQLIDQAIATNSSDEDQP